MGAVGGVTSGERTRDVESALHTHALRKSARRHDAQERAVLARTLSLSLALTLTLTLSLSLSLSLSLTLTLTLTLTRTLTLTLTLPVGRCCRSAASCALSSPRASTTSRGARSAPSSPPEPYA